MSDAQKIRRASLPRPRSSRRNSSGLAEVAAAFIDDSPGPFWRPEPIVAEPPIARTPALAAPANRTVAPGSARQRSHPVARVSADWPIKRALDLVLGSLALILLSPLMAVIAGLLMLGGGPVLFVQRRVGRDRTRFPCFKFRSMYPDAETRLASLLATSSAAKREWSVHQKLSHDPRVTRFGRFLRASSLDELPQLFNVVRGEMSLVGPRPIVAPELDGYESDRAYYESAAFAEYARCRPGITGLWQVSGRHRASHDERIRCDRWYARNWSLMLDLWILVRTVPAVIGRTGD